MSTTPGFEVPSFRRITWEVRVESYKEQARRRTESGREPPMIETTFVTHNSDTIIFAVEEYLLMTGIERLPVVLRLPCRQQRPHTVGSTTAALFSRVNSLRSVDLNLDWGHVCPNPGSSNAMGVYDENLKYSPHMAGK